MAIERHLSVTTVADILSCSRGHIYDLIAAKKIRSTDIGVNRAKTRIPESEVARFLAQNSRAIPSPEVAA